MTPGVVRWFDGIAWTEITRPAAPVPTPVAPVPVPVDLYPRDSAYGQPVGFGAPAQATTPAYPPAGGAYASRFDSFGQASTPYGPTPVLGRLVDEGAIRSARRATLWSLAGGIVALVVGGVLAIGRARAIELGLSQSSGRYIATGGLLAAAVAFVRAGRSYRAMVDQGGDRWSTAAKSLVVGTAGLALVLSLTGIVQVTRASMMPALEPAVAGSCWTDEGGGEVLQVRCSAPHDYVATLVVRDSTGAQCPADGGPFVLDLDDGTGTYLCLADDPTAGT